MPKLREAFTGEAENSMLLDVKKDSNYIPVSNQYKISPKYNIYENSVDEGFHYSNQNENATEIYRLLSNIDLTFLKH